MGNDLLPKPAPISEVAQIENRVVRQGGVNILTGKPYEVVQGQAEKLTSDTLSEEGLNNRQPIDTGSAATVEAIRTGRSVIVNRSS